MHPFLTPWTGRTAIHPLIRLVGLLVGLTLASRLPARAEVLRLTNDSALKAGEWLNSAGEVLWESRDQLYLWSDGVARSLTQTPAARSRITLGEGGQVAWIEGGQVYLWVGAGSPRPISPFPGRYENLSLNRSGHVVWDGFQGYLSQGSLSFWDGVGLRAVPVIGRSNAQPVINDLDEVLWVNEDGPAQLDLWDGAGVRALSSGRVGVDSAAFNQEGQVVWHAGGIFLWDGESTRALFSDRPMDLGPDLNAFGQVAWAAGSGLSTEIFLWDGSTVRQLSANGRSNFSPWINRAGQVVWESVAGSSGMAPRPGGSRPRA
jgi:hypothetical protein